MLVELKSSDMLLLKSCSFMAQDGEYDAWPAGVLVPTHSKVCFATCFDPDVLIHLQSKEGQVFHQKSTSYDISCHEIKERQLCEGNGNLKEDQSTRPSTLFKKHLMGRYALSAQEFNNDLVHPVYSLFVIF